VRYWLNSDQFLKTSPHHDAAATMLHCGDGVIRGVRAAFYFTGKNRALSFPWGNVLYYVSTQKKSGPTDNRHSNHSCGTLQLLQGYLWLLCYICNIYYFLIRDLMGLPGIHWDFKFFFITHPYFLHALSFSPDLFGEVLDLHLGTCLVVPFTPGVRSRDR